MKLLEVVTPPSVYHACFTRKTFLREHFTGEEKSHLVSSQLRTRKIVVVALLLNTDISRIVTNTSPRWESNIQRRNKNLGRSEMELISSLGINAKVRPDKYKKARYSIGNIIMKDPSKIIRYFEKLPNINMKWGGPNTIPLVKCMLRADPLNSHIYPLRTETTGT